MGRRTHGSRAGLAAAALLAASTLTPWPSARPTHAAGGTLTVAITAEPDTLDPQVTGTAIGSAVDAYIGDTLVRIDTHNKVVPSLAKSWTISPDGLTYTFALRSGVTFQDGTTLDAAAYAATFKRLLDPATKAAVQAGRLGQVASVTASGNSTLTIKLKQPFAFLLYNLTDSNFAPLSPTALKSEGSSFGRKPISTGPWQVQQWDTGSQIVLTRNPNYRWGPAFLKRGPVGIDRLVFRILPNPAAATDALLSGEVDELTLDPASVQRIQSSGQYTILKSLDDSSVFFELNVTQAPFTDVRVRQAMNYAIDKQAVVQVALNGLGVPIYGVLNPQVYGYWPGIKGYGYAYNPQKALALLAQAGYTKQNGVLQKGGKPLSFTILASDSYNFGKVALVIQDQLKSLGIAATIQSLQFATEIATIRKGTNASDIMGYTYPLPDIFYIWFHSSQIGTGFADSFYRDARLDALIVKMRSTIDTAARNALIQQLERYIVDRALIVPIYDDYLYTAFQQRVKGALTDPRGRVILNNVSLS